MTPDAWRQHRDEVRAAGAIRAHGDEPVVRQTVNEHGYKELETEYASLSRLTDAAPDVPAPDGKGTQYTHATYRQVFELHRNTSGGFVIAFAATGRELARCDLLAHHTAWTPLQTWTFQQATGANDRKFFRLPPLSEDAAAAGTFEFEATQGRAVATGLSVIADPLLTTHHWRDASDIQALLHSRLLDVVLLCLRQRAWLDQHAEALAKVYTLSEDDEARQEVLLDQGNQLGHFRNARWFTEVPGHPEATALLRALQDALDSNSLLKEASAEEDDLLRMVRLRNTVRQAKAAEARSRERELTRQREDEAAKQRERERESIERALAIITVGAIVPSLFAVFGEPGLRLGIVTLIVTVVLMVAAGFVGPMLLRRITGRSDSAT